MTVDHRRRLQLYEVARERFGVEAADTLMELLPPMDPSELATQQDLVLLRADVRVEMQELRSELRGEMQELRGEMQELRSELRGEMQDLRSELRGEMQGLRVEMHELFREQTNRLLMFIVPTMLSTVGLAFAATHL